MTGNVIDLEEEMAGNNPICQDKWLSYFRWRMNGGDNKLVIDQLELNSPK